MKIRKSFDKVTITIPGDCRHTFYFTTVGLNNCLHTLQMYYYGSEGNVEQQQALKSVIDDVACDLHELEKAN